jgi:hypothetical protein
VEWAKILKTVHTPSDRISAPFAAGCAGVGLGAWTNGPDEDQGATPVEA